MNVDAIDPNSRFWALLWFVFGTVATVVYGIFAADASSRFSQYFRRISWKMESAASGEDEDELPDLESDEFDELLARERLIPWVQSLALGLFVIGVGVAIEGLN